MKLYINGSPKLMNSNSNYFLNYIRDNDTIKYVYKDSFNSILKDIDNVDTIILSFPLYVDSPPSKVIELFEYISNNNIDITNKKIYVICNCGFLESKHNDTAIRIVNNFCINHKAKYMGSFAIGSGEIIGKCDKKKIYKIVSIPFFIKFKKFKKTINNNKEINLKTTIRPMNKWLYVYLANINWKKR